MSIMIVSEDYLCCHNLYGSIMMIVLLLYYNIVWFFFIESAQGTCHPGYWADESPAKRYKWNCEKGAVYFIPLDIKPRRLSNFIFPYLLNFTLKFNLDQYFHCRVKSNSNIRQRVWQKGCILPTFQQFSNMTRLLWIFTSNLDEKYALDLYGGIQSLINR